MKKIFIMLMTVAMLASFNYMVGGNGCFNTQVCAETAAADEKSELDKQLGLLLNGIYDIVMEDEDALGITEIDMVFDAVESILGTSDMDNAKAVLEKLEFDVENSEASDSAKKKISDYIKKAIDITDGVNVPDVSSGEVSDVSEASEAASAPESAGETESSVSESTGSSSSLPIVGIVIGCVLVAVVVVAVIVIVVRKNRRK